MGTPEGFIQLAYRAPGIKQMKSTTVRKPDNWAEMNTKARKAWALAECNRVCPGATEARMR